MSKMRARLLGCTADDPERAFDGYTAFSSVLSRNALLLDPRGEPVHHWFHPDGIQHLRLLDNGNVLAQTQPPEDAEGLQDIGGSAGALVELDWDSNVVWTHADARMHHDYARLADGATLYIAWDRIPLDVQPTIRGGHRGADDPERMWADVIKRVEPSGDLEVVWRSWEHLDPAHHEICPLESRKEWTHANSLDIGPDGRWLVSLRLTSRVIEIDPTTGEVIWRWGEKEASHQHAATWLANGNVLVFDNGCHRVGLPSFSRVVEIEPSSKKIAWSYLGTPILDFYSFMVSGASRLPNGNTFITDGANGRLFEVTEDGDIVWEFHSPFMLTSRRFGPTPAVFRAYKVAADHPALAGRDLSSGRYPDLHRRLAENDPITEDDVDPFVP